MSFAQNYIPVFGDSFSENWAIIIAAVALVGMAVWGFAEGKGKRDSPSTAQNDPEYHNTVH